MKPFWKKTFTLVVVLSLLIAAIIVPSSAVAERSSLYLSRYRAWLTPKNNGAIAVTIDVQAVGDMDDVGAISVTMYESSDGGSTWSAVRGYSSALYPDMLAHDTYLYFDTPITHIGRPGNKYCAIITIYAGDSTGYDTREYQTSTITAKWQGD